jgi:hypothetical protein
MQIHDLIVAKAYVLQTIILVHLPVLTPIELYKKLTYYCIMVMKCCFIKRSKSWK